MAKLTELVEQGKKTVLDLQKQSEGWNALLSSDQIDSDFAWSSISALLRPFAMDQVAGLRQALSHVTFGPDTSRGRQDSPPKSFTETGPPVFAESKKRQNYNQETALPPVAHFPSAKIREAGKMNETETRRIITEILDRFPEGHGAEKTGEEINSAKDDRQGKAFRKGVLPAGGPKKKAGGPKSGTGATTAAAAALIPELPGNVDSRRLAAWAKSPGGTQKKPGPPPESRGGPPAPPPVPGAGRSGKSVEFPDLAVRHSARQGQKNQAAASEMTPKLDCFPQGHGAEKTGEEINSAKDDRQGKAFRKGVLPAGGPKKKAGGPKPGTEATTAAALTPAPAGNGQKNWFARHGDFKAAAAALILELPGNVDSRRLAAWAKSPGGTQKKSGPPPESRGGPPAPPPVPGAGRPGKSAEFPDSAVRHSARQGQKNQAAASEMPPKKEAGAKPQSPGLANQLEKLVRSWQETKKTANYPAEETDLQARSRDGLPGLAASLFPECPPEQRDYPLRENQGTDNDQIFTDTLERVLQREIGRHGLWR